VPTLGPVLPCAFGRYTLVERVGAGGMATVYRALLGGEGGFEKEVAVKVVREELASEPQFRTLFLDEARLSARLAHANLVQTFDFGQVDGIWFLAMEYVRGRTLANLLRALRTRNLWPGPVKSLHLAAEVAKGLGHAHRLAAPDGRPLGLVHRDVSPQNVLVSTEGEVKLGDFGIAKAALSSHVTQPGKVRGKCAYMAPEQARGRAVDARADVFALGVVLWECLTGTALFDGGSDAEILLQVLQKDVVAPSRIRPGVPPEVDALVLRMLARDPDVRPTNGDQAARELAALELRFATCPADFDLRELERALRSGTAVQLPAAPGSFELAVDVTGVPAPPLLAPVAPAATGGAGRGAPPTESGTPTVRAAPPPAGASRPAASPEVSSPEVASPEVSSPEVSSPEVSSPAGRAAAGGTNAPGASAGPDRRRDEAAGPGSGRFGLPAGISSGRAPERTGTSAVPATGAATDRWRAQPAAGTSTSEPPTLPLAGAAAARRRPATATAGTAVEAESATASRAPGAEAGPPSSSSVPTATGPVRSARRPLRAVGLALVSIAFGIALGVVSLAAFPGRTPFDPAPAASEREASLVGPEPTPVVPGEPSTPGSAADGAAVGVLRPAQAASPADARPPTQGAAEPVPSAGVASPADARPAAEGAGPVRARPPAASTSPAGARPQVALAVGPPAIPSAGHLAAPAGDRGAHGPERLPSTSATEGADARAIRRPSLPVEGARRTRAEDPSAPPARVATPAAGANPHPTSGTSSAPVANRPVEPRISPAGGSADGMAVGGAGFAADPGEPPVAGRAPSATLTVSSLVPGGLREVRVDDVTVQRLAVRRPESLRLPPGRHRVGFVTATGECEVAVDLVAGKQLALNQAQDGSVRRVEGTRTESVACGPRPR
jgi:tRNA A-37 threonylcarbamoyl transferase component Bud32